MSERPRIPRLTERQLYVRFHGQCFICLQDVLRPKTDSLFVERAHIEPFSFSHNHDLENLVLLCPHHHEQFDRVANAREHLTTDIGLWRRSLSDPTNFDFGRFIGTRLGHNHTEKPSELLKTLNRLYREYRFCEQDLALALSVEAELYRVSGRLLVTLDLLQVAKKLKVRAPLVRASLYALEAKTLSLLGRLTAAKSAIRRALAILEKRKLVDTAQWFYVNVIACELDYQDQDTLSISRRLQSLCWDRAGGRELPSLMAFQWIVKSSGGGATTIARRAR